MTRDPATLPGAMTIAAAATFFADGADHRSYPVVDDDNALLGLVSRTDALRWQVGEHPADTSLAETLSDASLLVAYPATPIGVVADLMVDSGSAGYRSSNRAAAASSAFFPARIC